jgi:hypothetical protein
MNVFILNSGRCGSTTWIRACAHIDNFSAGHETRSHLSGDARLDYPDQHIEADNRLSWLLGRLDRHYGDRALYVHLQRDPEAVIRSFARRRDFGILRAYHEGILLGSDPALPAVELATDYLETVQANIALFLRDKPHSLQVRLEHWQQDFPCFWQAIGASGDLDAALQEFCVQHNSSASNGLLGPP